MDFSLKDVYKKYKEWLEEENKNGNLESITTAIASTRNMKYLIITYKYKE